MSTQQGIYWFVTLSCESHAAQPSLADSNKLQWLLGQKEQAAGGFLHWQFVCGFQTKQRLSAVKKVWPAAHLELCRSVAAEEYVTKEESRVPGSEFELGVKKLKVNSQIDWAKIKELAKTNRLEEIDAGVYIRNYSSLKRIATEHLRPAYRGVQEVNVYWGLSGSGKTHRVFQEAGDVFYIKSSTTKWFDSYRGEENIILDEFTGSMDIVHMLKWLDCYPLTVEIKGGQVCLASKRWWITSNVDPDVWYQEKATPEQCAALRRRFTNVVHYTDAFKVMMNQ